MKCIIDEPVPGYGYGSGGSPRNSISGERQRRRSSVMSNSDDEVAWNRVADGAADEHSILMPMYQSFI